MPHLLQPDAGCPSAPIECLVVTDMGLDANGRPRVMLSTRDANGMEFERLETFRWLVTPEVKQRFADRLALQDKPVAPPLPQPVLQIVRD